MSELICERGGGLWLPPFLIYKYPKMRIKKTAQMSRF